MFQMPGVSSYAELLTFLASYNHDFIELNTDYGKLSLWLCNGTIEFSPMPIAIKYTYNYIDVFYYSLAMCEYQTFVRYNLSNNQTEYNSVLMHNIEEPMISDDFESAEEFVNHILRIHEHE